MKPSKEFSLDNSKQRAEDIILGSIGLGEAATLLSVKFIEDKSEYHCLVRWDDGLEEEFKSDSPVSELERWAIQQLV